MSANHRSSNEVVLSGSRNDAASVTIYENHVPAFVASALDSLYQNPYSTITRLRIAGNTDHISVYVVSEEGMPVTVLLFRLQGRRAHVLNNVVRIDASEVRRFCSTVFARFDSVGVILFETIETDLQTLDFPYQRFNTSENIVLSLPSSVDEYVASLGKNTRKNVKYYLNRLKRSFPSFEYRLQEREQVGKEQVLDILRLKSGRVTRRHGSGTVDDRETDRTLRLVNAMGMVGVIRIGGRICAGSIGYRVGSNTFGGVLAHDKAYDGYWIGMLCCFLTICESIALGCREYHFLWGQDDYKFRMMGVQRDLDDVTVYRSRAHAILNLDVVCAAAMKTCNRQARLWIRRARRPEGSIGMCMAGLTRLRQKAGLGRT